MSRDRLFEKISRDLFQAGLCVWQEHAIVQDEDKMTKKKNAWIFESIFIINR